MQIERTQQQEVIILKLDGRIDNAGAEALNQALELIYSNQQYKVVLDMATTQYINSAGLRILADFLTRNREAGGDLVLAAMVSKVRRIFEIVGFINFFSSFENVESALATF